MERKSFPHPILSKRNRQPWKTEEQYLARELCGQGTPGSGNGKVKGDIHFANCIVEAKTTQRDSFSLKEEVLNKICAEAHREGKYPVFTLCFLKSGKRYVVLSWDDFVKEAEV